MLGTTFADRYRIHGVLGSGVNGQVWRATDLHQQMEVALKTYARGRSILAYEEATILTALEGEHVLRVYNADSYQDVPYLATRIAPLGSTGDVLKSNKLGVPPHFVTSWTRQALVGLGACHDRRLVHRDIKPENVFLESQEKALLGDFGLAARMDGSGRVSAEGSPLTMAPEMWSTASGDGRSDIYSMGVTMYRLATGIWPFEALTRADLAPLVLAGQHVDIRDEAPHISRRLAKRIRKAMATDPNNRYASWGDMHSDMSRAGLTPVAWRRTNPHPGHEKCWIEVATVKPRTVCVLPEPAGTRLVETRRSGGSRILDYCDGGMSERDVPKNLRAIFDSI